MAVDVIPSIAERYRVSLDAAHQIERALRATGASWGMTLAAARPRMGTAFKLYR